LANKYIRRSRDVIITVPFASLLVSSVSGSPLINASDVLRSYFARAEKSGAAAIAVGAAMAGGACIVMMAREIAMRVREEWRCKMGWLLFTG
jgi:hypothetical protein